MTHEEAENIAISLVRKDIVERLENIKQRITTICDSESLAKVSYLLKYIQLDIPELPDIEIVKEGNEE